MEREHPDASETRGPHRARSPNRSPMTPPGSRGTVEVEGSPTLDERFAMGVMVIVYAALGLVVFVGLAWFMVDWSRRADNVRKHSETDAESIEATRFTLANPAALPMHDRAFDKPKDY